jgi:hypothetical protein
VFGVITHARSIWDERQADTEEAAQQCGDTAVGMHVSYNSLVSSSFLFFPERKIETGGRRRKECEVKIG